MSAMLAFGRKLLGMWRRKHPTVARRNFSEANTDSMNAVLHKEYVKAKNSVAVMMGMDPLKFSDTDFKNSVEYLLPTDLKDKLARPSYNSGIPTIHMRKEMMDDKMRPHDSFFYSGAPSYFKLKYQIYHILSTAKEREPNVSASSFVLKDRLTLERILDEAIDSKKYDHLAALGRDLNSYDFPIQEKFLEYFHDPSKSDPKKIQVSYKSLAVGRRKTSIAKVRVKNGDGKVVINSRSLLDYFPRLEDRQQVLFPLNVVGCLGKVDVSARVSGGGITGQAGAIRVGLSRALANFSDLYAEPLEEKKLTLMDIRRVERKKPGRKKARKSFAWVKR